MFVVVVAVSTVLCMFDYWYFWSECFLWLYTLGQLYIFI